MASVNFMKCKGAGHAKAIMRHSEKEERLKHEHSNPDIDKSCTEKNSSLYGLTYDEMCAKLDDRIRTLDETTNTNKRSDRVVMFSLEYSVPEGLPAWLENEYLADCEKLIAEQYGERNIIESERHMDEKHKYMDHGEEKMSRAHGHTFVVPEIDGKLNGKFFSSKSQMMKLNKAIEEMSMRKYQLHFMTGKLARHQSVEELKRESAIEQQNISIQKNNEILQRQYERSQGLKAEKEELTHELTDLKDDLEQQKHDLQVEYQLEEARLEAEYAEKKKLIAEREVKLAQKEKAIEGRELKPAELTALEQKTFWSSEDKQNVLKTAQLSAKHTQEAEALERENKKLEKDVKTMKPKFQAYDTVKSQVRHRDEELTQLEKRVQQLEEDIKVRDSFIRDRGMMQEFVKHVQDMGIKLSQKVEEMKQTISHSLHIR